MDPQVQFGSLLEDASQEIKSMVTLTFYPKDLANYWRVSGLTANFGASFLTYCFPEEEHDENTLSFILNEAVENAIKYSSTQEFQITISLYSINGEIIFEIENPVTHEQKEHFEEFLQGLINCTDYETMYMDAMERNMTSDNDHSGGMGLLTLLHDYHVHLGVKFNPPKTDGRADFLSLQIKINPKDLV